MCPRSCTRARIQFEFRHLVRCCRCILSRKHNTFQSFASMTNNFTALLACNKKLQRTNATDIAYDGSDTKRLVEDGMSTGLENPHMARGFSDLYLVFARKRCMATYYNPCYIDSTFSPKQSHLALLAGVLQLRVFAKLLVGNEWVEYRECE